MSDSLFSADWYRVADLKPRLRPRAELHRREMRGRVWHLAQDHQSGRFYRLSPAAYLIVCLLDGRRTVREAWEATGRRHGAEQPSQDETIQLLTQLHRADLLIGDLPPDISEIVRRGEQHRRHAALTRLRNPLALRLPLFDPDRFLTRTMPLVRPLLSPFGLLAWLALMVTGIAMAAIHWTELTADVMDRVFSLHSVALVFLTYPLVKAAHELGHAYACKRFGGAVHEIGVMLLVLFPVPYVDATEATAFPHRWQRALVGAAGIMVELVLACVALIVWVEASPGAIRAAAFNVMLIGGVSTLLFNGNPLLRFDGYYVLCDLIGLPNLAQRAGRFVTYLIQRHAFGDTLQDSPAETVGERRWLLGFALASTSYRMTLTLGIAMLLASRFLLVGALLGAWSVFSLLIWPLLKGTLFVTRSPRLTGRRGRALIASAALAGVPAVLLFGVSVPYGTLAQGVVRLPETAMIRARTDGIVTRVTAAPGAMVRRGDPILSLEDPAFASALAVLEAQARELTLRRDAIEQTDRVSANLLAEQVRRAEGAVDLARTRLAEQVLRAPRDGVLVLPEAGSLPGRFTHRGDLLGQVVATDDVTIRVVVPQDQIDLVRQRTAEVDLRLAHAFFRPIPATIRRELPAAVHEMPSAALGLAGGGDIATDPGDASGTRAFEQTFLIDIAPAGLDPADIWTGERAFVRFDHGAEPFGWRLLRGLRGLFLKRLDV
ncbi:MAG: putative peptide zinc metalloprotease protein [Acetobacteraceae bacterium]|nr:putative peptide zinc metalloprotease protein [Acetobacteraceae bacterium]